MINSGDRISTSILQRETGGLATREGATKQQRWPLEAKNGKKMKWILPTQLYNKIAL